jgi:glyceraldehyde-3-phosphate dehydrogenase/erythrose-4-phosphate dehydrogenase
MAKKRIDQLRQILNEVDSEQEVAEIAKILDGVRGRLRVGRKEQSFWANKTPCWELVSCPESVVRACPAPRYQRYPCWQIEGTHSKLTEQGMRGDDTGACATCRVHKLYGQGEPVRIELFGKGLNRGPIAGLEETREPTGRGGTSTRGSGGTPRSSKRQKIVHVIGTGTIGEPLIVLLCQMQEELGIDEVTFNKRTPRSAEKPDVANMMLKGARLCVQEDKADEFVRMGLEPSYSSEEAVGRASVVIDCTPAGNKNKDEIYRRYEDKVLGFIAQGSETGFGKPYAFNITDGSLEKSDKYVWIVSCNTHNIATVVWTIALDQGAKGPDNLVFGDFAIFRRANDISQATGFIPSPEVGKHDSEVFGTHQAEDARTLFGETKGFDLNLFSSAAKINTQQMHVMRFSLDLREEIDLDEVKARIARNPLVATTEKTSTSLVFSFGRDQGHYGRILNQTVVPTKTLIVVGKHRVTGFCFTPQDGNSLLSSTAATLWYLHPEDYRERMRVLQRPPFVFQEI